jgi:hypothetical protein
MSDERLPIEVLNPAQMTSVEGRVLVHGQDEQTGRNYLMLEGTDAKVHFRVTRTSCCATRTFSAGQCASFSNAASRRRRTAGAVGSGSIRLLCARLVRRSKSGKNGARFAGGNGTTTARSDGD